MCTMKIKKYIHRLEGRMRKVRLQDVFDGNNIVMFEVLENLQLSQSAFSICQHFKSIGDLLYRHLLACEMYISSNEKVAGQGVQLSLNDNVN